MSKDRLVDFALKIFSSDQVQLTMTCKYFSSPCLLKGNSKTLNMQGFKLQRAKKRIFLVSFLKHCGMLYMVFVSAIVIL